MLMQKEYEMLNKYAAKGTKSKMGSDGLYPQERHKKLYNHLLEENEKGIYAVTSHEFRKLTGCGKFEYTNSVHILRKYGVVGVYHHRFVKDGIYYAGFVYLKCNEEKFENYMMENFGVFDPEKFEYGLQVDIEKNVSENIDEEEIKILKNKLSYKISRKEYKRYKELREKGFNRNQIAKYFEIPRWKLVAAVDNANNNKFKELQRAN